MILFFYGPNTFAAKQKLKGLIERYEKASKGSFGLERINTGLASQTDSINSAEKIISAITAIPFLTKHRLVVLEGVASDKKLLESILPFLEKVPKETVVVFCDSKPDERTKAFKHLLAAAKSTKFTMLTPGQLESWVKGIVLDLGGNIDTRTTRYLLEKTGNNQWRIWNEVHKLTSYNSKVTVESIDLLVEGVFENTIFDLVEALALGKIELAIKLYLGLRQEKAQPIYILSMIIWQIRNLLIVASAEREAADITRSKLSPYVINKTRQLLRVINFKDIVKSYRLLQRTDLKLKTKSVDADIELQNLMFGIVNYLHPSRIK